MAYHSTSTSTLNDVMNMSIVNDNALYKQPQNTPVPTIVITVAIIDANGHLPTQPASLKKKLKC